MTTINERTACLVTFDLVDETGAAVPLSALTTLTLTLYNRPAYGGSITYINSRNRQNVLNANNVTVSSTGAVAWTYQRADGAIVDDAQVRETHVALFEATWSAGALGFAHEELFDVVNLATTP